MGTGFYGEFLVWLVRPNRSALFFCKQSSMPPARAVPGFVIIFLLCAPLVEGAHFVCATMDWHGYIQSAILFITEPI